MPEPKVIFRIDKNKLTHSLHALIVCRYAGFSEVRNLSYMECRDRSYLIHVYHACATESLTLCFDLCVGKVNKIV